MLMWPDNRKVGSRLFCLFLLVTASLVPVCFSQSVEASGVQEQAEEGDSQEYKLGPGDLFEVRVFGVDALNQTARVSNSGKIHFPHLGVIRVAGFSTLDLQRIIAEDLEEKGLVQHPQVQIEIVQHRAEPVYILGEVGLPGQFVIKEQMFLMDLITMAGGVNDLARPYGFLYRRHTEFSGPPGVEEQADRGPNYQIVKVELEGLVSGTDLAMNVRLRGGDIFYVPERQVQLFYVVGDVNQPGAYEIPLGPPITATQAISWAGGPTKTAKMSDGMLVRFSGTGSREELETDFAAILRGRKADFLVEPDDIIFVPGSTAKTIGYGLLGIIPGFTQGAIVQGTRTR